MGTDCFADAEALESCRLQVSGLRDHYYCFGSTPMLYGAFAPTVWQPLNLNGLGDRLTVEIRAKNALGCALLLDRAMERVRMVPHRQSQALWLCGGIDNAVRSLPMQDTDNCPNIEALMTRAQVLTWLVRIKAVLTAQLGQNDSAGRNALLEKARQYVRDNVDKRILLQDAADYVCLSPGYLSALFKKQYNQSFVDFINEEKCRRACELICQEKHRINEISYMLGFENAYYFTRVFKRHTGMTPTEYQRKLMRE